VKPLGTVAANVLWAKHPSLHTKHKNTNRFTVQQNTLLTRHKIKNKSHHLITVSVTTQKASKLYKNPAPSIYGFLWFPIISVEYHETSIKRWVSNAGVF